ncbi:MAG: MGH1-like glycoside hydrolase domain-containing protein [Verrucomicrobiota bacterium]
MHPALRSRRSRPAGATERIEPVKALETCFTSRGSWLTVVPRPEGVLMKTIRAQVLSLKGHEEWASDARLDFAEGSTVGEKGAISRVRTLHRTSLRPLSRFTMYWLTYHRSPRDSTRLCFYRHGNDSGGDNATVFDQGMPTYGADLAAYLVVQMEVLADLAGRLGKEEEAAEWQCLAEEQFAALMTHCVVDGRFVSPLVASEQAVPSRSTFNLIPLILGHRLPREVIENLLHDLRPDGPVLTPYGIVSEAIDSPKFEEDGYWRGAFWVPHNVLIYTALRDLGETVLAREVALRYTRMCRENPSFSENHSALSGRGLQVPEVGWTFAAFAYFARQLIVL